MPKCQKCGDGFPDMPIGRWLRRVNRTGIPGIWECRPYCGYSEESQEEALLSALAVED